MSDITQFIFIIISTIFAAPLPYLSSFIMISKIEKRIKLRATPYFYVALIVLVIYLSAAWFTEMWTTKPEIGLIGTVILAIGLFLVLIFVLRIRQYLLHLKFHEILAEILKVYLPIGAILCTATFIAIHLEYFFECEENLLSILAMVFIMHSYLELGSIYKKLQRKDWFLFFLGAILFIGVIILNELVIIGNFGGKSNAEVFAAYPYLLLFEFIFAFSGGFVATTPSLTSLLRKPLKKIEEGPSYAVALFAFVAAIGEIMGGSTTAIFKSAIEGYNRRFKKNIKIDDTIHLSEVPDKDWPKLIDFVFLIYNQCIGPITFEEAKKIEGLTEFAEMAEEKYRKM